MGYILYDVQLPLTIEKNPHGLCTNAGGERRRGGHLRQRRLGLQDRGLALAPGRRQGGHGGAMAGPLGPWRSWGGVISPYSMDILGVIYKPGAAQKGLQIQKNHALLVGGFKHEFYFPFHIWDVILPID